MYSYKYPHDHSNLRQRQGRHRESASSPPSGGGMPGNIRDRPRQRVSKAVVSLIAGLVITLAWFSTPISDFLTDELLDAFVPLSEDLNWQQQALRQMHYQKEMAPIYSRQWTEKLQLIGRDLLDTAVLEATKYHSRIEHETSPSTNIVFRLSALELTKYDWSFQVVHSANQPDAINAFCLPGGAIHVTKALLDKLQPTDSELAALLGHEIGHVVHRHAARRVFQETIFSNMLRLLRTLTQRNKETREERDGADSASRSKRRRQDDGTETILVTLSDLIVDVAAWLGKQRFSRRDEYQADATAWHLLLSDANRYHPKSLIRLLMKLDRYSSVSEGWTAEILSWGNTHPATKDRIQTLQQRWNTMPVKQQHKFSKNPT